MNLPFKISPVFLANCLSTKPLVINQGGTRSGKTWSILQYILFFCFRNTGKTILIVRKTQAEISATVLADWMEILLKAGLYNDRNHHKTKNEFYINGNVIRFVGIDKAQKRRGMKCDLLYINEANGLTLEDWTQLSIRSTGRIFIDFNPSERFWAHDIMERAPGTFDFIKSTYLDNMEFLPADQVARIQDLINVDDFYYKVYVLGEMAVMKGLIYQGYNTISPEDYERIDAEETFYGLDFGYDHPMALMEIKYANERVYEREVFYGSKKTDEDLIKFMDEKGISMTADIYADPAGAASIFKLQEAGYNVRRAKKDVKEGIRFLQQLRRTVCSDSGNYLNELKTYKWKQTAQGDVRDEPVKLKDDACDAVRYGEFTHLRKRAA